MAILVEAFLSCLYGSERVIPIKGASTYFLSCLYGSEQGIQKPVRGRYFLSCLYGSERKGWQK